MKEYIYEGRRYRLIGKYWIDDNNMTAPIALQKELDRLTFAELDLSSATYREALEWGDAYKARESYSYAISCYERAIDMVKTHQEMAMVLPRITSCFRKLHRPERVLEILAKAEAVYGEDIISEALLTSAAAAYCDMDQPENAYKCCARAFSIAKKNNREPSEELLSVYARVKSMLK